MSGRESVAVSLEKCKACGGKCCRYVAVEIDKPRSKADFDDIRWYVAHEGVSVFIEDGDWYINFDGKCRYLTLDSRCAIYERKPRICTEHPEHDCEEGDDGADRTELHTPADVEEFMAQRFRKRRRLQK
ncbi:MAG: YkgJ family cysteine cluster protein [Planctomycetes bacterium]|nr:YkgJ family cysteine cluster protein [Planctomycetota bacterium]